MQTLAHAPAVHLLVEGRGFPRLQAAVSLVVTEGGAWLVDCGSEEDRTLILERLARLGYRAESLSGVILTHLHRDHCENLECFADCRLLVHQAELRALSHFQASTNAEELLTRARDHHQHLHSYYQRQLTEWVRSSPQFCDFPRLEVITQTCQLEPGLRLVETPGHSCGHLAVEVLLSDSCRCWLAGDAISTQAELRSGSAPSICWNLTEYLRSRELLLSQEAWLIPSHGPPFLVGPPGTPRARLEMLADFSAEQGWVLKCP